jgi:glyoxylate/hydroxypyruvate reductase A
MTVKADGDHGVLLVRSGGAKAVPEWQAAFAALLPGLTVRGWDDPAVDPATVRYVLVWEPDAGRLAGYPNLELIFSSAAGVDHITADPHLPRHVPIVRMGADEMAQTVSEYVCLAALAILRDVPRLLDARQARRWDPYELPRTARDVQVGIMGMGRIGTVSAGMLRALGFRVSGWTRDRRDVPGVQCFAGADGLAPFLGAADILACILPDTAQTRGMLDARRLAMLKPGASVVNVGRGTLVVLPDLIAALDSGHLNLAVLDVFDPEPLAADSPAWTHPRIMATSHVAGYASRPARAEAVVNGILAHRAGGRPANLFEPARGY